MAANVVVPIRKITPSFPENCMALYRIGDDAPRVAADACKRSANSSVQRSFPFVVAACPSVIESPKATIAAESPAPLTSTPDT